MALGPDADEIAPTPYVFLTKRQKTGIFRENVNLYIFLTEIDWHC
jgi:hypothetical protein